MAALKPRSFANRLLLALPESDIESFARKLTKVELPRRAVLEHSKKKVEHIYFLEAGIASIVATPDRDTRVEVGIIGREGMTGLSVVHLGDRTPYSAYMQVGGVGNRASADAVRELMESSAEARRLFLGFAQAFHIQTAETAVANARATVEERLARWLLMAQDRIGGDEVGLTHEFLALMMGARRPGVTEAMHDLERKELVEGARGKVIVINRTGLMKCAGTFYGVPEAELTRLMRK